MRTGINRRTHQMMTCHQAGTAARSCVTRRVGSRLVERRTVRNSRLCRQVAGQPGSAVVYGCRGGNISINQNINVVRHLSWRAISQPHFLVVGDNLPAPVRGHGAVDGTGDGITGGIGAVVGPAPAVAGNVAVARIDALGGQVNADDAVADLMVQRQRSVAARIEPVYEVAFGDHGRGVGVGGKPGFGSISGGGRVALRVTLLDGPDAAIALRLSRAGHESK